MKAYVWMSFPKCFPHSLSTFNFNTRALVQKNRKLLSLRLLYRAGVRLILWAGATTCPLMPALKQGTHGCPLAHGRCRMTRAAASSAVGRRELQGDWEALSGTTNSTDSGQLLVQVRCFFLGKYWKLYHSYLNFYSIFKHTLLQWCLRYEEIQYCNLT